MPRKKSGVAYVNIETPVEKRSNQLLRCHADLIPSRRPMSVESTVDRPTSQTVGQIASRDLVRHRSAGPVRRAEVAAQRLAHVQPELLPLRLVEPELVTQARLYLGRHVPAAEQAPDRVALHDPEQEEVEDEDDEQREDRPDDLATDEARLMARARPRSVAKVGAAPAAHHHHEGDDDAERDHDSDDDQHDRARTAAAAAAGRLHVRCS